MSHKTREMLISQRTQLINGLRGHLTEVGVIAAQGPRYARELADLIEAGDETIPLAVCEALAPLVVQLRNLDEAIARLDRAIAKMAQKDETARRLMSIPGIGPITASAMVANVQDASGFAGPREFAAFLGLTPKQNSSGGKQRLGRISKMGNHICANYSSWGRMPCCFIANPIRTRCACGRRSSSRRSPSTSSLWRSPTKWRALPLRSCAARRAIEKFRRDKRHKGTWLRRQKPRLHWTKQGLRQEESRVTKR